MANQGTGLTLIKQMDYRGNTEEWSNTYWFHNAGPGVNDPGWNQIWSDVWGFEKQALPASTQLVQVYGYNDRSYKSHAVFDHQLTTPDPGTLVPPANVALMAGDQAACVQWKTDHKNSRGKWVYLRKYLHHGFVVDSSTDTLPAPYVTALTDYANRIQVYAGGLVPGPSKDDQTPGVYTVTSVVVHPYVTTRTLKRRGKRPKASP